MKDRMDILNRRALLLSGAGLASAFVAPAVWAAGSVLPSPKSLADELTLALKAGQPLVVMVSLEGCPFCRVARDSYLGPMRRQEDVPVVQIDMRTSTSVRDFNRAAVTHDDLARAWSIKVAPTVLFFGAGGKEVAERLVGGYIADFYGAYLDQRMQTARAAVKS
jgi:thioredoxin-related protein